MVFVNCGLETGWTLTLQKRASKSSTVGQFGLGLLLSTPRHSMTPQLCSTLSLPDLVHLWLLADRHSSTLTPQNNPFPRRRREPIERRIASDSHRDQSSIICAVSDEPRAAPSLTPEFHASGYVTS